jgi:osmotically-inducible protein OsmY
MSNTKQKTQARQMETVCQKEVGTMKSDRGRLLGRCPELQDSDLELESRVRVFLAGLKVPGLRGVTIGVNGGIAIVSGTVSSFHEKQLATHCCQRVAGVVSVVNDLHVDPIAKRNRPLVEQRPA